MRLLLGALLPLRAEVPSAARARATGRDPRRAARHAHGQRQGLEPPRHEG